MVPVCVAQSGVLLISYSCSNITSAISQGHLDASLAIPFMRTGILTDRCWRSRRNAADWRCNNHRAASTAKYIPTTANLTITFGYFASSAIAYPRYWIHLKGQMRKGSSGASSGKKALRTSLLRNLAFFLKRFPILFKALYKAIRSAKIITVCLRPTNQQQLLFCPRGSLSVFVVLHSKPISNMKVLMVSICAPSVFRFAVIPQYKFQCFVC